MKTMQMKYWLAGGMTLLMTAGIVRAEVISQTKTFSGQPNYSSVLTFDQFDDNGGTYTLNSILVTVQLDTAAGARLGIDNDGADPATGTVEFGSSGFIKNSSVSLLKQDFLTFNGSLESISSKSMTLSGDDGDATVYSTSGTDFEQLLTVATSESDSAYINSAVFGQYTGDGIYTLEYSVSQFMNMGAFSGSQFQGDPVSAGGSITVEYDYTIPEPASIAMIGLVGGAALFTRRLMM